MTTLLPALPITTLHHTTEPLELADESGLT